MEMATTLEQIEAAYVSAKTYPALVLMLIELGIESYTVDVTTHTTVYRLIKGQLLIRYGNHTVTVGAPFSGEGVRQAIYVHTQGKTDYVGFMQGIARAGVHFYEASLAGDNKRVTYIGATDCHVEHINF
jgi:uncharacterized protein YbcV (DUF1398 family)